MQSRAPSAALQGLPSVAPPVPYRYVLFHFAFITVTRRSVNLAIAASCLTFTALQACAQAMLPAPASTQMPSGTVRERAA